MDDWLYIAACIAVPGLWGAVSAWLFSQIDRRRKKTEPGRPPVDYMI